MEIATLNTRYLTRSPLKVRVIRVDSPTRFWVQLDNSKEDFKDLMEDLARRMTRRSRFPHYRVYDVRLDDLVVVQEGRRWHRGIVLQIQGDGTVSIDLRDWGRLVERHYTEIYILEDRFCELEWQAISCALAHTGPLQLRITWPRRARELIKFLIDRREAWINIIGDVEEEAAIVNVKIRTECGTETKNVKDILVDLGHAQHTEGLLEPVDPSI